MQLAANRSSQPIRNNVTKLRSPFKINKNWKFRALNARRLLMPIHWNLMHFL